MHLRNSIGSDLRSSLHNSYDMKSKVDINNQQFQIQTRSSNESLIKQNTKIYGGNQISSKNDSLHVTINN